MPGRANDVRAVIHELAAAAIGLVLAAAVAYLAISGRSVPGELTAPLGTIIGYFFGVGTSRVAQNGHGR